MTAMTRRRRIEAVLGGQAPDRPPFGFWSHFPDADLEPERIARQSVDFFRRYGMDFLKSMPNGLYCVEDWGCVCDFSEVPKGGVAKVVEPAVRAPEDWQRIGVLDVTGGAYGRELAHLRLARSRLPEDAPLLATVFSPLTVAAKMSNGLALAHMREAPDALAAGLETIVQVTADFSRRALGLGCDGVFLATQTCTPRQLDEEEFRRFGRAFDLRLLSLANGGGWFSCLHMHGEDVHFDLMADYPTAAINWHIGETRPTVAAYRTGGGKKPILGGLVRGLITEGNSDALKANLTNLLDETGGAGIIVGPGCGIRHPLRDDVLAWLGNEITGAAG